MRAGAFTRNERKRGRARVSAFGVNAFRMPARRTQSVYHMYVPTLDRLLYNMGTSGFELVCAVACLYVVYVKV